jgi:preprotein translocase subunit SecE
MSQDGMSPEISPATGPAQDSATFVERIRRHFKGVRTEMRQVSWPTWKQVRSTTLVVFFFVFLMSIFVYAIDSVSEFLYRLAAGR